MSDARGAAHIRSVSTWDSGGGVELDVIELEGGTVLVVGDETVAVYRSLADFHAEADEGDQGRRTVTLLRETGRPFELAGAR